MEDMDLKDKELIDLMLQNEAIEKAICNHQKHKRDADILINLLSVMAQRANEDGGFIVSVKCPDVFPGLDNIEILSENKHYELMNVEGKDNKKYVMVFTSKERYKMCDDTSGVIMFIDHLLRFVEQSDLVDGIVINLNKEQLIWDKIFIRMVLVLIEQGCQMEEK